VHNLEHICLIGSGKLSRHLAKILSIFKDKPLFIWGRNSQQAESIASEFGLVHLNGLQDIH
jgi:glutamyl-tRNA reductase